MHAILSNTACFAVMHSQFLLSVEFSFPQDFFSLQHKNCASIQFNFNFGKHPERLCDDAQKTEGS